jgi:hypothetical protein
LWAILFATFVVACAIDMPPPGGPVDETPAKVAETFPAAGSSGVDPGTEIGIMFSEDMTRARVERLVQLSPPIEIGRVQWKDRTIFIKPVDPLHPDTTYLVTLKPGFRDDHKVTSMDGHEFVFATSAAVDSGAISGTIYFRRKPTDKGVVRCFVLPVDSGFTPGAARPDREARTDDNGDYELGYLPNRGNGFIVWAFEDANKNGVFAPNSEAATTLADTVVLRPEAPIAIGLDIYIVDPKEPAALAGVVVNRSALDTLVVSVALFADSIEARPSYLVTCDSAGAYEFARVMTGRYLLRAFVDVVPDSLCGWYPCFDDTTVSCAEPCVQYPDTLLVEPGSDVKLDTLTIEPVREREE